MLTGLKVSLLACNCVFYGPENKIKRGPNGTKFRRSCNPKRKLTKQYLCSKRVHLFSYHVTPRVMVIETLKRATFCIFLLTVWAKYLKAPERVLLENDMVGRLRWSVVSQEKKYRNSLFSGIDIMLMVESNNTNHFLKEQNKNFRCT